MSASAPLLGSSGSVGVVFVGHGTLVTNEFPSPARLATIASTIAVGPAEYLFVKYGVGCAVNKLLFGEANWVLQALDRDSTLESSSGAEGPTGTTLSLVLNWAHKSIISPIDIDGSVSPSEISVECAE